MTASVCIFGNQHNKGTILLNEILSNSGLSVSRHNSLSIPTTFKNIDDTLFIDADWLSDLPSPLLLLDILKKRPGSLFIYNWNDSKSHNALIKYFIGSVKIKRTITTSIHWADNYFCGSLAGHSSSFVSDSFTFSKDHTDTDLHVLLDEDPILMSAQFGSSSIYFMTEVNLDTDYVFSNSDEQEDSFLISVSPVILFLRNFLWDKIWHAEVEMGCFILDDPPLRSSYGFANYSKMLKATNPIGAISIAFIPWYYTNSKRSIAKIISENYGPLSLCIHGCDHTWNEFCCSTNSAAILFKEALRRMKFHSKYYSIPCDKILVFPQGRFSINSLKALSGSGVIAAINSTFFSHGDESKIASTNLITPVLVRFGFPIFKRRYPSDSIGLALDRLLDRPIFFAEHHTFFRNGYSKLKELFQSNRDVVWSNPADIINKYYQIRTGIDEEILVRFFSSTFTYTNKLSSRVISFETSAINKCPISVHVNTVDIAFKYIDKTIYFSKRINQGAIIYIEIEKKQFPNTVKYKKTWKQRLYIRQRRCLSEFRDNYISKYKPLEVIYEYIRNFAKP